MHFTSPAIRSRGDMTLMLVCHSLDAHNQPRPTTAHLPGRAYGYAFAAIDDVHRTPEPPYLITCWLPFLDHLAERAAGGVEFVPQFGDLVGEMPVGLPGSG